MFLNLLYLFLLLLLSIVVIRGKNIQDSAEKGRGTFVFPTRLVAGAHLSFQRVLVDSALLHQLDVHASYNASVKIHIHYFLYQTILLSTPLLYFVYFNKY
jgi:hypothetical protein